jgi:hypothetical protein
MRWKLTAVATLPSKLSQRVPSSNFGRGTDYCDRGSFGVFFRPSRENSGLVHQFGHDALLPDPSQFIFAAVQRHGRKVTRK